MELTTRDKLTIQVLEAKYSRTFAKRAGRDAEPCVALQVSITTDVMRDLRATASVLKMSMQDAVTAALMGYLQEARSVLKDHNMIDAFEVAYKDAREALETKAPTKNKGGRTKGATRVVVNDDEVRAWYAANGRNVDKTARHFGLGWKRAKEITSTKVTPNAGEVQTASQVDTPVNKEAEVNQ